MRGDVHMACLPAISVMPQVAAGTIKILAVSLPKRSPFLPDIPTLKEARHRRGSRYLDGF